MLNISYSFSGQQNIKIFCFSSLDFYFLKKFYSLFSFLLLAFSLPLLLLEEGYLTWPLKYPLRSICDTLAIAICRWNWPLTCSCLQIIMNQVSLKLLCLVILSCLFCSWAISVEHCLLGKGCKVKRSNCVRLCVFFLHAYKTQPKLSRWQSKTIIKTTFYIPSCNRRRQVLKEMLTNPKEYQVLNIWYSQKCIQYTSNICCIFL